MRHSDGQNSSTAQKIIEIIPYVGRVMASEMRQGSSQMRHTHFRLLGMVSHRSWTLSDLAEKTGVSAPTMSNTITTLEERGWVTRVRSEEDRRVVLVRATEEGRQLVEETFQRVQEHIDRLLEPLTPIEHETLLEGLDILRRIFEQEPLTHCQEHQNEMDPDSVSEVDRPLP